MEDTPAPELTEEQKQQIQLIFNKFDEKFVEIINIDKLEPNGVVLFKVSSDNIDFIMSLPLLVEKYREQFKEKNISILILRPEENIETLSEEKMNKIGWFKKEQNVIITPDKF